MPGSSESHRVKIGLFHPVLIKILINKDKKVSCEETTSNVFSVFAVGLLHRLFVSLCADNVLRCEFSAISEVCLTV